ncbi:septum site-determining protein MinC [Pseudocolwellia sp. AS88]|uniref:septum site-determining protein MinC n=1 Tax=Pseudocolwellia sp. AS88 TaxID=3063958 RepID=UPI0026F2AD0B|nr:septum site-determining protein MinC [Pseudocolwellia sp. AS88]MDO7083827.1 septum site-determining protein MinC [Pseudocolwellia sp. AS88]
MSEQEIELKGTNFTLSVIQIENNDLTLLDAQLKSKIAQAPQFFHCAPVVVDIKALETFTDFVNLKQIIENNNFVLVGICGHSSAEQKKAVQEAGLAIVNKGSVQKIAKEPAKVVQQEVPTPIESTVIENVPTKVVKGQIRSGQQIYAKNTDLIIMGSVGNGAEVIADGNIHVYGTIRGRAIAGASGQSESKIFCQNLQAELVSIAGVYMLNEQLKEHANLPQCIQVEDQQIIFNQLN